MLRIIPVLAVLACSGCFPFYIPPSGPDKPKDLSDVPLEVHVAHARKKVEELGMLGVGLLPRDLGAPGVLPSAIPMNDGFFAGPGILDFRGLADGRICFGATDFLDKDSSESAEELSASFEKKELEHTVVWIEAVKSLDALAGRKAWPAGPTATRLVSAEVVGDEVKTFTEKKQIGDDDEYIEVKEDRRVVEFEVCGNGFELPPGSNYLVGVVHAPPSEHDEQWSPRLAESSGPEYEERLRMQHDSLLVWMLTDDGTVDLSK